MGPLYDVLTVCVGVGILPRSSMANTPYFILILFYAGFIGSVVVLNVFVLAVVALAKRVWDWQRAQGEQSAMASNDLVAHAS